MGGLTPVPTWRRKIRLFWPTWQQWRKWSLPAKATWVGAAVSTLALVLAVAVLIADRKSGRPSLDVVFDSTEGHEAFNFSNRGRTNLYIWGTQLDAGPKSLAAPRTITPGGSYHIWAQQVAKDIRTKLSGNGETRVPFRVYVSTEDDRRHEITYELWILVNNGVLRIETQNLGSRERDFTQEPSPR
jgi:hypothetical protein